MLGKLFGKGFSHISFSSIVRVFGSACLTLFWVSVLTGRAPVALLLDLFLKLKYHPGWLENFHKYLEGLGSASLYYVLFACFMIICAVTGWMVELPKRLYVFRSIYSPTFQMSVIGFSFLIFCSFGVSFLAFITLVIVALVSLLLFRGEAFKVVVAFGADFMIGALSWVAFLFALFSGQVRENMDDDKVD